MRELAAELGVNRATLFRWVGNRDDLLAEILWSLAEPTLAAAIDDAPGHGGQRIATAIGRFATLIDQAAFFRDFLRREPERALRILTTRAGTVQSRLVTAIETFLREEITAGQLDPPLPPHDLAYLIVRIAESFCIRRHHHRRADRHRQDRAGDRGVGQTMSQWTPCALSPVAAQPTYGLSPGDRVLQIADASAVHWTRSHGHHESFVVARPKWSPLAPIATSSRRVGWPVSVRRHW